MEVQVISATVQRFNGESFYLCGNYYQRKGKRLHRTVWEHHNGEIPKGYHVHHVDEDRSNNQIENLVLLVGSDHNRKHMSKHEVVEKSRESIQKAIEKAPEWHRSSDGYEWHSKHAKEYWENAPLRTYTCDYCGKEFQSRAVRYTGNHFCHNNCKAAFRRRRLRNEG
mgnify:CR=1 FL=1